MREALVFGTFRTVSNLYHIHSLYTRMFISGKIKTYVHMNRYYTVEKISTCFFTATM